MEFSEQRVVWTMHLNAQNCARQHTLQVLLSLELVTSSQSQDHYKFSKKKIEEVNGGYYEEKKTWKTSLVMSNAKKTIKTFGLGRGVGWLR